MSKLNITEFLDKDVIPQVMSPLVDEWQKLTGELPSAIVLTEDQWDKFFFAANERVNNFRGIPLETPTETDRKTMVIKTIDSILAGMHTAALNQISEVYRMLEAMKAKIGGQQ